MRTIKNTYLAALAVLLSPMAAQAELITYDFSWTGANNYSMLGWFSFDDSDAGDGAIRDGEVSALVFEGFNNGVSIGVNNSAHTQGSFNFNFNALAGQFFLNGDSFGDSGQRWNFLGSGLGYGAGSNASTLSVNNQQLGFISNPNNLTATLRQVPEPGTLALLGLGLAGIGFAKRKKA